MAEVGGDRENGSNDGPPYAEPKPEAPSRGRVVFLWVATIIFGLGVAFSVIDLVSGSAEDGEWFALVATSVGFLCGLGIAIENHRGHSH